MRDSTNRAQPTTLVEILRHRAIHQPQQIAYQFLLDGDQDTASFTYQALDHHAQAIAAHLQSIIAPGDRVLLLYPPGLDYIAAFFGCLYAGAIAIPAYPPKPNRSVDRIQTILQDAQAQVALTTQPLLTQIKTTLEPGLLATTHWLTTDAITTSPELLGSLAPSWQKHSPSLEAIALLQYTSGSTAAPKGVKISYANLWHNLSAIQHLFHHSSQSKGVIWLPPYHDMGLIGGILQPLFVGFPVVLMAPALFMQRPLRWLKAISQHRATTSGGPNFAYDRCLAQLESDTLSDLDLSSWQVAFNGAEPIRAETLAHFADAFAAFGFRREAFYPCYGLAEATLLVSGNPRSQSQYAIESQSSSLVSCGQPLADQTLLIVNPITQAPCAAGEIGEIWLSGDSVAQGYWNRPEETAATFNAQLADGRGRFLRTGDLGLVRAGELLVTGRLKDLIIIRGQNHYPQDIELSVQTSHRALQSAAGAAVAIATVTGEALVIVQEVTRDALRQLDAAAVIEAIRQAVATQHDLAVEAIALLKPGSIPKTSSGKVKRYQCRTDFLNEMLETVARWRAPEAAPIATSGSLKPETSSTATEEEIQHWLIINLAAYLKVEPATIDIDAPFAQYGLDSSVAISLTDELAQWLGVEQLEPMLFWEHPSIAALATHLSTQE
jgi:acyl-CoA synthetase (AMP-forming)/AMP-acid ligase II/acyl carrier protein